RGRGRHAREPRRQQQGGNDRVRQPVHEGLTKKAVVHEERHHDERRDEGGGGAPARTRHHHQRGRGGKRQREEEVIEKRHAVAFESETRTEDRGHQRRPLGFGGGEI